MEYLIPESWFVPLPQWALLLIFAVGLALIIKGADWLVLGVASAAHRLGVSKVVIAATVLSLGTTSPETAVSVAAAWRGEPGLALGNSVGSVIADTGLILGLGFLLAVLPADRFILMRQGAVQIGVGLLMAAICYGSWALQGEEASLGRGVGVLFLSLLVVYMVVSVRWGRAHPSGESMIPGAVADAESEPRRSWASLIGFSLFGLVLVIVASHLLISSVTVLAEDRWGVPKVVIAASLVALGTSLPELVIGLTSLYRGQKEVLIGNVIGADILNILWVTGAAAIASPLQLLEAEADYPSIFLFLHLPTMVTVLVLFLVFILASVKRGQFRRWYAFPLLGVYATYLVLQFVFS